MAPYLALGRFVGANAVGQYNRLTQVCGLTERVILSSVGPVALPAFGRETREGRDPKPAYMQALQLISAVQWPSMLLLAILAHPVVLLLLGEKWIDLVPLVQLMAVAKVFSFQAALTLPMLIALGRIRACAILYLLIMPASVVIIFGAATFGILAVVISSFVVIPFQCIASLWLVGRLIRIGVKELLGSLSTSLIPTLGAMLGCLIILAGAGFPDKPAIPVALLAVVLAAIGWVAGLWLGEHPLWTELRSVWLKFKPRRQAVVSTVE